MLPPPAVPLSVPSAVPLPLPLVSLAVPSTAPSTVSPAVHPAVPLAVASAAPGAMMARTLSEAAGAEQVSLRAGKGAPIPAPVAAPGGLVRDASNLISFGEPVTEPGSPVQGLHDTVETLSLGQLDQQLDHHQQQQQREEDRLLGHGALSTAGARAGGAAEANAEGADPGGGVGATAAVGLLEGKKLVATLARGPALQLERKRKVGKKHGR